MLSARHAPTVERSLDPVLDLMRLLWSIEHGLQRMSKRMENALGITGPQRLVLRVVGRFPDISASELAYLVRLHPSTITGILQRLAARGFLERRRDPADTRRVRLRLNRRALAYTRMQRGTVEHAVRGALTHVGPAQVRAARLVLTEVANRLNDLCAADANGASRQPLNVRGTAGRRTR